MKNKIIEILELETFNTSDEAGNNYKVVEDCDFDKIAEKIVKLFAISVVSNRRELLIAFAQWLAHEEEYGKDGSVGTVDAYLESN